jgi:hypothetical protein
LRISYYADSQLLELAYSNASSNRFQRLKIVDTSQWEYIRQTGFILSTFAQSIGENVQSGELYLDNILVELGAEQILPSTILSWDSPGEMTCWIGETNTYIGLQYTYDLMSAGSWYNADLHEGLWNIVPTNHNLSLSVPPLWDRPATFLRLICSVDPLPEAPAIGDRYELYGGDSFDDEGPSRSVIGYDPASHGFTFLGSETNSWWFEGGYNVYIIRAPRYNVVNVDAFYLWAESGGGNYIGNVSSGDTPDPDNVTGSPDGLYASVGGEGFPDGGFIVIHPNNPGATSISVELATDFGP